MFEARVRHSGPHGLEDTALISKRDSIDRVYRGGESQAGKLFQMLAAFNLRSPKNDWEIYVLSPEPTFAFPVVAQRPGATGEKAGRWLRRPRSILLF